MNRLLALLFACALSVAALLATPATATASASDCDQLFSDWNSAVDGFVTNFNLSNHYQDLADGVTGTDPASNYTRESYQQSANTYGALADSYADYASDIESEMRRQHCI